MPASALPNQFSRGIVDKTLYVRRLYFAGDMLGAEN
jgi:hypothetical protein